MKRYRRSLRLEFIVWSLGFLLLIFTVCLSAAESVLVPAPEADPHYTQVGFFDVHVCNWPDESLFLLGLFSSARYADLAKVELFTPANRLLGELDFNKFRVIQKPGKPEKHAYIKHFTIPNDAGNGWYKAIVTLRDGSRYTAEDFVVIRKMGRAENLWPADGAEDIPSPDRLSWDPIPGAKYYRVFIRDVWEGTLVFESKLLTEPELVLPKGLIQAGGYYSWQVHARDDNENVLLGDFNHGSLNDPATFSVTMH